MMTRRITLVMTLCWFACLHLAQAQPQPASVPQYQVHELTFEGDNYKPQDSPVADVVLTTTWRHESGWPSYTIYGYYDGDGKGGLSGNVFKVRFCPTEPGSWTLEKTESNAKKLHGQHEGFTINCTQSAHKGFWEVDKEHAGSRWYKRSDGSHSYIVGNTLYSFLSEYYKGEPTGGSISRDVEENARYFNKIRFSITGDIFPTPEQKPFLDDRGKPTDDGNFSHRPNPAWFQDRVDLAVKLAYDKDMIADIIMNGPDSKEARSALYAAANGGDSTPFLRYIAARYASYPNVWLCLSNEYDIRNPVFSEEEIKIFGFRTKQFLAYPTPLSVHANQRDWDPALNTIVPWNDHLILQCKLKTLYSAADFALRNYWIGGGRMPLINDELAYEGAGDGWSEADVVESHLGALLGCSYGSTGHKSGNKEGHYFAGNFKLSEHTAADNLAYLRKVVDENISFWRMTPVHFSYPKNVRTGIFGNISDQFRSIQWGKNEYLLGTNAAHKDITAELKTGQWQVKMYDLMAMTEKTLTTSATGDYVFDAPDSRAVLFHFKKMK